MFLRARRMASALLPDLLLGGFFVMLTKPHLAEETFTLHLLLHLRSHYMGMDDSGPDGNRRAISSRPALRFIGVFTVTGGRRLRVAAQVCATIGAEV
jgi:hypothetical protein